MKILADELARAVCAGERPALARALSLVERDPLAADTLMAKFAGIERRAHVIGLTGPPGAGKSTLVGVLARRLLQQGRSIAILAVDPSSPISGGALLGDRFRIGEAADGRCFIRSTATRGSLGGLTAAARRMTRLMDVAGYDLVIVETVGTGQSESDVAALADTLCVVFPPGLGDELQAIKAGILELADLLVVTKAETPAADHAIQSLRGVVPFWKKSLPIVPVSSVNGTGLEELVAALLQRAESRCSSRCAPGHESHSLAMTDIVERLFSGLPRHLAGMAAVSRELVVVDPDVVSLQLQANGTDACFLLGQISGALAVLAPSMGARTIADDLTASRVRLTITRSE